MMHLPEDRSIRRVARSLVGALFSALLLSCGSDSPKAATIAEGCILNTDCNAPLVCAFRRCHTACTNSRDCAPGQRCVASDKPFHVCQLEVERFCKYNSDCPQGQACGSDLQCRDQCLTTRDCVDGQVCTQGTCAETHELRDSGLLPSLSDAEAVSVGQPCVYNSECPVPLTCRAGVCALECLAASDCSPGYDCVQSRCLARMGVSIDDKGGQVVGGSGRVTLVIPPASVRSSVSILVANAEAWPPGAVGVAYQVLPSGITFNPPARITFQYTLQDLGGVPETDLAIAVADGARWTLLPSTVDVQAKTVSASIQHLSVYGLVHKLDAGAPEIDASVDGAGGSGGAAGTGGASGTGGAPGTGGAGETGGAAPIADASAEADADVDAGQDATLDAPDAEVVVTPIVAQCVDCVPNCTDKCSGQWDGCNGFCTCPESPYRGFVNICLSTEPLALSAERGPTAATSVGPETCSLCAPNCIGRCNGESDGCGGTCGCEPGLVCQYQYVSEAPGFYACTVCQPYCSPGWCGADGCGGVCGCQDPNAWCSQFQMCMTGCEVDQDCPSEKPHCDGGACKCVPDCTGKCSGEDDGCGGTCGCQDPNAWCSQAHMCTTGCEVDQDCPTEKPHCNGGTCECVPNCNGRSCGPDGCGGNCGACADGGVCVEGTCCTPSCSGRTCGWDGCLGSCGECGPTQICNSLEQGLLR